MAKALPCLEASYGDTTNVVTVGFSNDWRNETMKFSFRSRHRAERFYFSDDYCTTQEWHAW